MFSATFIEDSPEQPTKAYALIFVTLFGILTDCKPVQPLKAPKPILTTLFGIVVFLQPAIKVLVAVSIMALQLSLES